MSLSLLWQCHLHKPEIVQEVVKGVADGSFLFCAAEMNELFNGGMVEMDGVVHGHNLIKAHLKMNVDERMNIFQ
jgi:hypothetical protein